MEIFSNLNLDTIAAAWNTFTQSSAFKILGAITTFLIATSGVLTARLEMIQKLIEAVNQVRSLLQPPSAAPILLTDTTDTRSRLLRIVKSEYARRQQDSLHNLVMIDLGFQDRSSATGRPEPLRLAPDPEPVDRMLALPGNSHLQWVEPGRSLFEVYNQVTIGGKLLILGKPGSGKTTELLKFATQLTTQAEADPQKPIPVLLELSTWNESYNTFDSWIVHRLKRLYNIESGIAQVWINNEQLVLLLDGLNELGLVQQERAIVAINQFLAETLYPHCVVCCRSEEYEAGKARLSQLNGAIVLQPLTDGQIQRYLDEVGRSPFWQSIEQQATLKDLARSPLLLTMMVTVYQNRQIRNACELFDLYIDYAFSRQSNQATHGRASRFDRPQVIRYLTWLAHQLKSHHKPDLLIERLQPSWLANQRDRLIYRLLCGSLVAVFCGLVAWMVFGEIKVEEELRWFMTAVGIAGGLLYGVYSREDLNAWLQTVPALQLPVLQAVLDLMDNEEIEPIQLGWSWHRAKTGLMAGLVMGWVMGAIVFLYDWVIGDFWLGVKWGFALFGTYACFIAVISGLQAGVRFSQTPNQGMWESLNNAIVVTLVATPVAMLVAGVGLLIPLGTVNWTLAFWIGVGGGLLSGLFSGGLPCIQHIALRFLLWRRGLIPWNYAEFLNYAHELRFIQRVGGRYRFIHELLREHFEALDRSSS